MLVVGWAAALWFLGRYLTGGATRWATGGFFLLRRGNGPRRGSSPAPTPMQDAGR